MVRMSGLFVPGVDRNTFVFTCFPLKSIGDNNKVGDRQNVPRTLRELGCKVPSRFVWWDPILSMEGINPNKRHFLLPRSLAMSFFCGRLLVENSQVELSSAETPTSCEDV